MLTYFLDPVENIRLRLGRRVKTTISTKVRMVKGLDRFDDRKYEFLMILTKPIFETVCNANTNNT